MIKQITAALIGTLVFLRHGERDERGLTQSTENAILLMGAVTVAGAVITAIAVTPRSRSANARCGWSTAWTTASSSASS